MIAAIIPVKSFAISKSRLDLPAEVKEELCRIMLEETLQTLCKSDLIGPVIVVSGDRRVFEASKKFSVIEIEDESETGVNQAVALADEYLVRNPVDASIVLPQDVPLMREEDIRFLLRFQSAPSCALIVPSRKFDGTNGLLRAPTDLMETHYDEDSYKIHLDIGARKAKEASVIFIRRMMIDVDDLGDLRYCLAQNEKPDLCAKIKELLDG